MRRQTKAPARLFQATRMPVTILDLRDTALVHSEFRGYIVLQAALEQGNRIWPLFVLADWNIREIRHIKRELLGSEQ